MDFSRRCRLRLAAIGASRTIYLSSVGLSAFSADGTNLWVFRTNSFPGTYSPGSVSASIAVDGTIYVSSFGSGSLYAISPAGTSKWRVDLAPDDATNAPLGATPAVDASGTIHYPA